MSGSQRLDIKLVEGEGVLFIAPIEGGTTLSTFANVVKLSPFYLKIHLTDGQTPAFMDDGIVAVLLEQNGSTYRADGEILTCEKKRDACYLELDIMRWQKLERRRSIRASADLSVDIYSAEQLEETNSFQHFKGTITEISSTGAWMKTDAIFKESWLIHVDGELPKYGRLNVLSEIIRGSEKSNGTHEYAIDFIDFLGDSKAQLTKYFQNLLKQAT